MAGYGSPHSHGLASYLQHALLKYRVHSADPSSSPYGQPHLRNLITVQADAFLRSGCFTESDHCRQHMYFSCPCQYIQGVTSNHEIQIAISRPWESFCEVCRSGECIPSSPGQSCEWRSFLHRQNTRKFTQRRNFPLDLPFLRMRWPTILPLSCSAMHPDFLL